MKCIYYLAPTLTSTHEISDDLNAVGIKDFYIHVISRDESGLRQQHIHSANYLETLDVVRVGFIGAFIGFTAGLVGVELLRYFAPFGPNVPSLVYVGVTAAATLFGAWEGGLIGVATENKKLARFHDDIEAGRYLILIYARKEQEPKVRAMMSARHSDAEFVAADRYFLNPFSDVRRRSDSDSAEKKVLQKG
jgi:hypothetical protein